MNTISNKHAIGLIFNIFDKGNAIIKEERDTITIFTKNEINA
jgi:hypothetical protein